MNNKYFYAFLKDGYFQTVVILSVIAIISCPILIQLNSKQNQALKDIQVKQDIIDHIPVWQAKLVNVKVVSKKLTLTLNGIILNTTKPMVIINGTILKLGGQVEDKEVTIITKNSATLCDVGSADKCIRLVLEQ